MSIPIYLALLLALLFLSLLFSGAETAFFAVNRLRLKYRAEEGDPKAALTLAVLSNPDKLLSVILLGNNLANIAAATLVTYMVTTHVPRHLVEWISIVASTALTLVVLVFCEMTPKLMAATHAEAITRRIIKPTRFFISVLYPIARIGSLLARRIVRLFGLEISKRPFAHVLSADELRVLIDGSTGDDIDARNKEMLSNVFAIGGTQVREIMIPRTEVTALEIHAPTQEVLELVRTTNHSRIPVYRGTFDNIIGILYVKDLLPYVHRAGEITLKALIRPVHFVPDTARLDAVMRQLQSMHLHMVGVVDEFGGVEGILTLEDLLEEIVGEIRDELDTEKESVRSLGPGLYSVSGSLAVKDFNRLLPVKIPEAQDYSTVVGFLQSRCGRLLKEGQTLRYMDMTFTVEKAARFKIVSLRVRVPIAATEGERLTTA